jgi:CheY-like chemotaxis protein
MIRILSLDDDLDMLEALHLVLSRCGYQQAYTTSSSEALELLKRESFDLFTQDWQRPDIDGLEFYRWMGSVESLHETPILIITASDELVTESIPDVIHLKQQGHRVRGFQTVPPERQPELNMAAAQAGLNVAYVDGYLPKPCTPDDLLRAVQAVLAGRGRPVLPQGEQSRASMLNSRLGERKPWKALRHNWEH